MANPPEILSVQHSSVSGMSRASLGPEATVKYRGNEHAEQSRRFLICTEVLFSVLNTIAPP